MSPILSYRTQALLTFATSFFVGLRTARQEDGAESVRKTVVMNVLATLGILVGYRLARRSGKRSE